MKNIKKVFVILVILLESSMSVLWGQSINIYVDGSLEQREKGTKDDSYITINEALSKAHELKIEQGHFIDTVYIWMKAGTYKIVEPITLNYKLPGLAGAPLVILTMSSEKISLSEGVKNFSVKNQK